MRDFAQRFGSVHEGRRPAKLSFGDKCVPKFNLGTRRLSAVC